MTISWPSIFVRIIVLLCALPFSRYPVPVGASRVGLPAGTCAPPPHGASPVLSSVQIGPVALPIPPVFSRKTGRAYALNQNVDALAATVHVLDTCTGAEVRAFSVAYDSLGIALDDGGQRLFVYTSPGGEGPDLDGVVQVFDALTGTLVRTFAVGGDAENMYAPRAMGYDPATGHLFVASICTTRRVNRATPVHTCAGIVATLDGRSGQILRVADARPFPESLTVDAKAGRVFVTSHGNTIQPGAITVLDARSGAVIRTWPLRGLGAVSNSLAVDSRAGHFIVSGYDTTATMHDALSGAVVRTLPTLASGFVVDEGAGRALGTVQCPTGPLYPMCIQVLDTASGDILATEPVSGYVTLHTADAIADVVLATANLPIGAGPSVQPTLLVLDSWTGQTLERIAIGDPQQQGVEAEIYALGVDAQAGRAVLILSNARAYNEASVIIHAAVVVDLTHLVRYLPALDPVTRPTNTGANVRYFPGARHTVRGSFLDFYARHGGTPVFGLPLSEAFIEQGQIVQYFERARMEYHPDMQDTPYRVSLGLLGAAYLRRERLR